MELLISYPLRGLHNLVSDNVNLVMVNGYGIVSSLFATLWILIEKVRFEKKKKKNLLAPKLKGCRSNRKQRNTCFVWLHLEISMCEF